MAFDEQRHDALQNELDHARSAIHDFLRSGDQVFTVLVTIFLVGALTIARTRPEIVAVFLPMVLVVPGAYGLRLNALIQHLGGYCQAVEAELERLLASSGTRYRSRIWEDAVAPLVKQPASWFLGFVFTAVWLASVAAAGVALNHEAKWSGWWSVGAAAGYVVSALILGIGFRWGNQLFRKSLSISSAALRTRVEPPQGSARFQEQGE